MLSVLSFIAGGVVVGWVAHKRPGWFAKTVSLVNAVDKKVNDTVAGHV